MRDWYQHQAARYRYRQGLDAVRKGSYENAIARFTQALVHHPCPAEIYTQRGLAHWQHKEVQKALDDFTLATQQSVPSAKAYGNRGLLRYQQGDEAGALADWQQALSLCPNDARVRFNRGLLFFQKQDYTAALEDFTQALTSNPNLAEAYYHRGNTRYELSDIAGAVEDWELALCNDLRLDQARERLQQVQRHSLDDKLSQRLQAILPDPQMTLAVHQLGERLDIDLYRPKGLGINYFTLPKLIRRYLIESPVPGVRRFRLTGQVVGQSPPEWQQTYTLYQNEPCPPAHWRLAVIALLAFPPLGVAALVYAYRVGETYRQGDYPLALQVSKAVNRLSLLGIGLTASVGLSVLAYLGFTRFKARLPQRRPSTALLPSAMPVLGRSADAGQLGRASSSPRTFQRVGESRGHHPNRPPGNQV